MLAARARALAHGQSPPLGVGPRLSRRQEQRGRGGVARALRLLRAHRRLHRVGCVRGRGGSALHVPQRLHLARQLHAADVHPVPPRAPLRRARAASRVRSPAPGAHDPPRGADQASPTTGSSSTACCSWCRSTGCPQAWWARSPARPTGLPATHAVSRSAVSSGTWTRPPDGAAPLLRVTGVRLSFGGVAALDDVSLTIEPSPHPFRDRPERRGKDVVAQRAVGLLLTGRRDGHAGPLVSGRPCLPMRSRGSASPAPFRPRKSSAISPRARTSRSAWPGDRLGEVSSPR